MTNKYKVSASPHLHEDISVKSIMWQVVIALVPAMIVSCYYFGFRSLYLTSLAVIAAVLTELLIQKIRKKTITISDGSAVVTGILVAFNLNVASPGWLPVVGSIFAIAIGKQVFGGLGHNIFNPALLARAFMVASWPTLTTSGWTATLKNSISGLVNTNSDLLGSGAVHSLVTSATPLSVVKALRDPNVVKNFSETIVKSEEVRDAIFTNMTSPVVLKNLFLGNIGGVIGEISVLALIIGAIYLLYKHIIEWRIPVSFVGTVFVLSWVFGGLNGIFSAPITVPIFHILSGGLILGAFFMATDMVTSPVTKKGRLIFGVGCGVITVTIRLIGGYPEGVSYSILLMNIFVPLIDRYTRPKFFGEGK